MNNIEMFYHYNELIKNLLIKSSPKDVFLNKDHLIKYEDLLFSTLDYCFDIFYELLLILSVPGYNKDAAVELKNKIYQELLYAQSDYSKIKKVFEERFSTMNFDFVKDVSSNILGYYLFSGVTIKPKSINELLHLIHHSALNNEFNYEILDLIKIESSLGEDIKIFGKINSFIQKTLPGLKTIGGEMHIMGLSDKTVIMVRDSGHASTLEIINKNEMYEVSYFIPKVCNMDMIKQLKGINYYSSDYARGKFLIEKNLNNELTDFILSIPTDKDMILNNDYYR